MYVASPQGPLILRSASQRRARTVVGGTYFRSREYGRTANLISVGVFTDSGTGEGVFVAQHNVLNPDEQVTGPSELISKVNLLECSLDWLHYIRIENIQGKLSVKYRGISWQIAPAPETEEEIGFVTNGRFIKPGIVSFLLNAQPTDFLPGQSIEIRPRTRRTPLEAVAAVDPVTLLTISGFDIEALRTSVNGDDTQYVMMPTMAQDAMNTAPDDPALVPFDFKSLSGGDGLPSSPVGINTGPTRSLILLNYGEREDGSLGEMNVVYEWKGESATRGSWSRYA